MVLNVQWDMKGVEMHLDTDIGKRFTLLGHTLTLLAGETDDMFTDNANTTKRDVLEGCGEEEDDVIDLSSPDTQEDDDEVSGLS